jgi:MFS family permease
MSVNTDPGAAPEAASPRSPEAPGTQATASPPTSPPASRFALPVLGLAALVAVLDGTVVGVALHPLADSFHTSLTTVVWVTIAYLLAAATMLPLLGWAMDAFGGRALFLSGLTLFLVGSALCALAPSAGWLIGFRAVQGLGGGLLEPTSLTLAAALATRENVGRVLGAMTTIINVAPAVGPIVGGALLETGHWQWIFLVNLPLGVIVLIAALVTIPRRQAAPAAPAGRAEQAEPAGRAERAEPAGQASGGRPRADVRGLVMLTVGYVAVLFALNRYGQAGAGPLVVVTAVAGVALLAGYARHALVSPTPPALDLRLLRRGGFAAALGVMGFVGLIMYSQLTSLPIFATDRHGLHGVAAGLFVCALGLGLLVSMSTGSRLSDRTGPRPWVRAGGAVTAALILTFTLTHDSLPAPAAFALFVGIGLSFGCTASPTFASIYRILDPPEQPQGTTALFMTVQFAGSLGVTLLGLLQDRAAGHWLTVLFALLTAAAVAITALSSRLPGRPSPG